MIKSKNRKLQLKFLTGLLILSVVLSLTLSLAIASKYRESMERYYTKVAFDQAKIAAEIIDGDAAIRYSKTFVMDNYYDEISRYLLYIKETVGLDYIYVVVPYEDKLLYIWDAGSDDENVYKIGAVGEYFGDGDMIMENALKHSDKTTVIITNSEEYGYLASAYAAIFNSEGSFAAMACVDISMDMINHQINEFVIAIIFIVGGILLLFIIAYFFFIRKSVLKPIETLNAAASTIISEQMDSLASFSINIKTGDELERLANSFTQMVHELKRYIDNLTAATIEKERIGTELDLARDIQYSMLPNKFSAYPMRTEFELFAVMTPAKEVGGDFYDFFLIDENHLALVIADVSGKGVPAALFMVISKTLIKNAAQACFSPSAVLETVNNRLCENNDADMFVTVWLGILEISTGIITCANAGHEYPVIKKSDGDYRLIEDRHGLLLACFENAKYVEYEIIMEPGDKLLLYTDGVTEATNISEELFGTDRMLAALNQGKDLGCEPLLCHIKAEIGAFMGDVPQFDDITMLCIELK